MGNCLALQNCIPSSGSEIVRVAKLDGKILEFSSPILVKDVLANFPALEIGVSKEASENLSPDVELTPGRLYHFRPASPNVSYSPNTEPAGGLKRVKIVITKHQLEQLVTKQISLEDVLSEIQNKSVDLPTNWKPNLDSIPEGNE